jgi:hypothetical protein
VCSAGVCGDRSCLATAHAARQTLNMQCPLAVAIALAFMTDCGIEHDMKASAAARCVSVRMRSRFVCICPVKPALDLPGRSFASAVHGVSAFDL